MKFKQFELDQFQIDSIASIEKGHSVVVSAATGTGKTLIADYIIDKYLKEGKRIIYTAPIKALSNQKYRDFTSAYGSENVGIITGDVQINTRASILIMTTEIYRNMLLTHDEVITPVKYVVFDEIHFLSDIERGTIWEEAIIFSPSSIRFLCLSATIPNAQEFADWISTIKEHNVDVVRYAKRAVPLKHFLYDTELGLTDIKTVKEVLELEKYPKYGKSFKRRRHEDRTRPPYHINVIKDVERNGWLPCFFFVFSRMLCERKAEECSRKLKFKTNGSRVNALFDEVMPENMRRLESVIKIKNFLMKGIGVHHAGLLPQLKELVERCFSEHLISVLYTTETFAVGINMPARCVIFNSLHKYDGVNTRLLNSKEYFQLAGRAGRRGIDKEGYAIALIDRGDCDIKKIAEFTSSDTEPIVSRFTLSYNTALHLFAYHSEEEAKIILTKSFDYYLRKTKGENVKIMASYHHKLDVLRKMGYIAEEITERGKFLLGVYSNELLMGEIFSTDLWREMTNPELLVLVATLSYEERLNTQFKVKQGEKTWASIIKKIENNPFVLKLLNKKTLQRLTLLVSRWGEGAEFMEIIKYTNMMEGDIIHLFRRMIDLMRQIRHSTADIGLQLRMEECMRLVDRDIVKAHI